MKNLLLTGVLLLVFTLLFLELPQNGFSDLFSISLTDSVNIVDTISKSIIVPAKGLNVPGTTPDTRAPSTVMGDGIPIGVVVPNNFNGVVIYDQNESALSSKFILVSQVINITPINGTAGDAPDGHECEEQCDVIFVIHESNVINAGLPVEELCNLKILHDVNDDGDFDDIDEVLETIVTNGGGFPGGSNEKKGATGTSNGLVTCTEDPATPGGGSGGGGGGGKPKPGFRVRSNDVPEFSKFAVGGIIKPALFVGGSSGSSSKNIATFGASTFSILESGDEGFGGTISSSIIDNDSAVEKVKVGEKIVLRFDYTEMNGIDNIAHVTLYLNGNGRDELQKSQTYIRWQKFEPLQIRDENGVLREAKFDILNIDASHFVLKFEIMLDKKLGGSDVLLKTWNLDRNKADLFLENVLTVSEENELAIEEKNLQDTSEPAAEDLIKSNLVSQPQIPMDALNAWAGFSEEQVSDSEFLEKLGIEGHDMPSWFKKSKIVKWAKDGLISQQEFFNALSFIVK
ncbi:MAG: hypothetical protein ACT4NJ_03760 [Nitrosopumilaceae archaeon]